MFTSVVDRKRGILMYVFLHCHDWISQFAYHCKSSIFVRQAKSIVCLVLNTIHWITDQSACLTFHRFPLYLIIKNKCTNEIDPIINWECLRRTRQKVCSIFLWELDGEDKYKLPILVMRKEDKNTFIMTSQCSKQRLKSIASTDYSIPLA